MFEILERRELADIIKLFKIKAPMIARKAEPGQFVILRVSEKGERIPLTIADRDVEEGTITIIFQVIGKTTKKLACLCKGDQIQDIVGPLGKGLEIKNYGKVVCVSGGVGAAPNYAKAKALKTANNEVIHILGARNADLLVLEEEMGEICDAQYIATNDGSKGHKGFVTDILQKIIEQEGKPDLVIAVGPTMMMRAVAELTKVYKIKTLVSLNPIMVDGTGMCGACRVSVNGENKFACIDGPTFDGHAVDFEQIIKRQQMYSDEEKFMARLHGGGECECH